MCRSTLPVLGEKANATRPEIEQILIRCEKPIDQEQFERELYIIRRRIEKAAIAAADRRDVSVQPVLPVDHLQGHDAGRTGRVFYPDLMDERFEAPLPSITSVIPPTPSRNGRWRSPSACWPITARSTR
jgi:glutamate synthase domain-containing protein 1